MGACWWAVGACLWGDGSRWAVGAYLWGDAGGQWALVYGEMLVSSGYLSMGECWWAVGACLWGMLVSSEHMSMGNAGGQ